MLGLAAVEEPLQSADADAAGAANVDRFQCAFIEQPVDSAPGQSEPVGRFGDGEYKSLIGHVSENLSPVKAG